MQAETDWYTAQRENEIELLRALELLAPSLTLGHVHQIYFFITTDAVVFERSNFEEHEALDIVEEMIDAERAALRTRIIEKMQNTENVFSR